MRQPKNGMRVSTIKDHNGKHFHLGDEVRHFGQYYLTIKGMVVYGYHEAGYDGETGFKHKTVGFFVAYHDGSGFTGLTPDWEVIARYNVRWKK